MATRSERGYALVAAVAAAAAFAYIALQVLAAGQGATALIAARDRQARLAAAADAGVMIALHGLGADDRSNRWAIDGPARHVDFDGVDLAVTVQDERGKAPLAGLNDSQSRALFEAAGVSGDRLDALVDEFRDWQAQDEVVPRAGAAAAGDLAESAPGVRRGQFRTVGELMALRDMDSALLARIAPSVTTFFGESGPFDIQNATPLAIRAMAAQGGSFPEEIARENAFVNQRPDETLGPDDHLVGRSLTVLVTARDPDGARAHTSAIVELTGDKRRPYWIRYAE